MDNKPSPGEIATKVREFMANPPPEVIARMKQRLAERRANNMSWFELDSLMHRRCGPTN